MVTDKVVNAKIDRPAGIVNFEKKQSPEEVLNAWSNDLNKMLNLIEKTGHLINKVSGNWVSEFWQSWTIYLLVRCAIFFQEYAMNAARATI